jgi:hypothetical protein
MRVCCFWAIFFASILACRLAISEDRGSEAIYINNETDEPIRLYIRPTDPRSPDTLWHGPLLIEPHALRGMLIPFYEPFDIDIRLDDDTDIVSESPVSLCWMMDNCRPGNQDWTVQGKGWRRDKNGVPHLDPSLDRLLRIHADKNTINLPIIKLAGKKLDDPVPPLPPSPQPKHPKP